jgi:hypothetical protein
MSLPSRMAVLNYMNNNEAVDVKTVMAALNRFMAMKNSLMKTYTWNILWL